MQPALIDERTVASPVQPKSARVQPDHPLGIGSHDADADVLIMHPLMMMMVYVACFLLISLAFKKRGV